MTKLAIAASVAFSMGVTAAMAAPNARVIGWVEVAPLPDRQDHVRVTGHVLALDEIKGRFVLTLKRVGKGGSANTSQSGKFELAPGGKAVLSSTAINIPASESVGIDLKLFSGDDELFSTTLEQAR